MAARVEHLASLGCRESIFTPGCFRHEARPIGFALAVDGLGAKRKSLEGSEHLEARLLTGSSGGSRIEKSRSILRLFGRLEFII